jgi:hypothetical protein
MNNTKILRAALVATLVCLLSSPAQALLFRAYVASDGNDVHPCTLPLPCRLLPAALAAVADDGEIWMLDSANYNTAPVVVTKSVTILAVPGALGSVVAVGGEAISIATPGVKVALRNLVIVPIPGGAGTSGVVMTSGAKLAIDGCLIANMPNDGIHVEGTNATISVTDSTIRDNGVDGIALVNGPKASITRAMITGSAAGNGVKVFGSAAGTTTIADIADSTMAGNSYGVRVTSNNATALAQVSVQGSRLRNLDEGISAQVSTPGTVAVVVSGKHHYGPQLRHRRMGGKDLRKRQHDQQEQRRPHQRGWGAHQCRQQCGLSEWDGDGRHDR